MVFCLCLARVQRDSMALWRGFQMGSKKQRLGSRNAGAPAAAGIGHFGGALLVTRPILARGVVKCRVSDLFHNPASQLFHRIAYLFMYSGKLRSNTLFAPCS